MKPKSQEDDFYSEVDKSRWRASCCTWQTMVIGFIILTIFASIVTIYGINKIKKINNPLRKIWPSEASKENFSDKLKIDFSDPKLNLVLTSEELTVLVSSGITNKLFKIDNLQVIVQEKDLKINGKLIKPIKSDLEITSIPYVENGKIKIMISNMTAGKLLLPGMLKNEVADSLNKLFDEKLSSIYEHYTIESINLRQDEMEIIGKKK